MGWGLVVGEDEVVLSLMASLGYWSLTGMRKTKAKDRNRVENAKRCRSLNLFVRNLVSKYTKLDMRALQKRTIPL